MTQSGGLKTSCSQQLYKISKKVGGGGAEARPAPPRALTLPIQASTTTLRKKSEYSKRVGRFSNVTMTTFFVVSLFLASLGRLFLNL